MSTYRQRHAALVKQIEKTATWQQEPEHEARHLLDSIENLTAYFSNYLPDDSPHRLQLIVNLHAMTEAFMDHYELWEESA